MRFSGIPQSLSVVLLCLTFGEPSAAQSADHYAFAIDVASAPPVDDEMSSGVAAFAEVDNISQGQARASEVLDATNAGLYRYFGTVGLDTNAGVSAGADTFVQLDPGSTYVGMMIGTASGLGNISAGLGATVYYAASENGTSGTPGFILTGVSGIVFAANTGGGWELDSYATATCGVIEVTTNVAFHNDCDIDNDGDTDADDIDLLTLALESGIGATGNANAVAMFDVNSDASVSEPDGRNRLAQLAANPALVSGDMDTLIHTCLGTEYGDANLDGVINQTDLDVVLLNWGETGVGWADGDFSGDGFVSQADFDYVLLSWGFGL